MSIELHYWILGMACCAAFGAGAGASVGLVMWFKLKKMELYFNGTKKDAPD